ncbi:MAG: peptidyl-prolyl cis-trans isomerase [Armatimonadetes bacterium]|nr:peptidyl-prolyl cis-trans isomerase [Armatimonadota bacterium]
MRRLGQVLASGAILLTAAMMTGCADQSPAVAVVGGSSIPLDDYVSMIELTPGPQGVPVGPMVMNQLIENELILQEARRQGVAPTPAELDAVMNEIRTRPEFQEEKRRTGLTDEQFVDLFLKPRFAYASLMAKMAGVTDADIQNYFQENKAMLAEPASVRARVLQFEDQKRAQEALKLAGQSTPEAIAQTILGTPQAAQAVTIRRGGTPLPEPVVEAAFNTPKGQHTQIIEATPAPNFMQPQPTPQAEKQFYIVWVEDQLPAREPSLQNPIIRNTVKQVLAQQKAGTQLAPTAFQDMIRNLRNEAAKTRQITVIRPTVKQVEAGPPEQPVPMIPGMPQ